MGEACDYGCPRKKDSMRTDKYGYDEDAEMVISTDTEAERLGSKRGVWTLPFQPHGNREHFFHFPKIQHSSTRESRRRTAHRLVAHNDLASPAPLDSLGTSYS